MQVSAEPLVRPDRVVTLPARHQLAKGSMREQTPATGSCASTLSRPYIVRLLEANEIASSKVGTHRRVLLADVLAYKARSGEQREAALHRMGKRIEASGLQY